MDKRVSAVIEMMRRQATQQHSIGTLSKAVNLSAARLRQLFKTETGRSPLQYMRIVRMQHAERLLRSTFLSVKEVAFLSGAKDLSHFVRDFKKHYGITPKEFRGRSR